MRIAVIGAGIIGLATAWELVRRGHDVAVFDPAPATGASRAAAGMLASVAEVVWGQPTLYPLMTASVERYPEFARWLEADAGHGVGYRTNPTLVIGAEAADRDALLGLSGLQSSLGMGVERLAPSQARRLEPALTPSIAGAVRIAGDHQIDPRQVTAALLEVLGDRVRRERVAAVVRGGDAEAGAGDDGTGFPLRHGSEGGARGYEPEGGAGPDAPARTTGIRLESGEVVAADQVLACPGLSAASIEGLPELPLRPVWGDILRLGVPDRLRPLVTHTVRGLVHGRPVYVVPRADGSLVLGATSREDGLAGVQAGGVLALLRDAERLVPGVAECEIREMLARPRPGTPDDVPLVGRLDAGLVVSTGYFRHGVLLAPLAAELGADLVEGRPIDGAAAAALDPFRFDPALAAGGPGDDRELTPAALVDEGAAWSAGDPAPTAPSAGDAVGAAGPSARPARTASEPATATASADADAAAAPGADRAGGDAPEPTAQPPADPERGQP